MAKAKSKKITIEDALLPVEEQPYEVPENWCWITIEHAYDVTSSKRVHKSDWKDTGIPFYRTRELVKLSEQGYVDNELFITEELYDDIVSEYGKPNEGDILVSGVGTIGIPYVVPANKEFYFKDGNVIWLKNRGIFDSKYMFYLYKSLFMHNQIYGMSAGTTVDTYTIVNANKTKVPFPPIPEQHRIVEQIESLFSKLDEAKEKAEYACTQIETHKASMLELAFSGELTNQWRTNKKTEKSWEEVELGKCCKIGSGGTPSRKNPHYYEGDIPWIKTGEIDWNTIVDAEEKITTEAIMNSSAKLYEPRAVLVAMYGMGATRGRAAILDVCAATNQAVCVLQPNSNVYNKFLYYYFMRNYWDIREQSVGGNQLNLSGTIISKFTISLPSMDEQIEITRVLDKLIDKDDEVLLKIKTIISNIDLMKKSILAKAFRGELGTNDPSEESSIDFLKQIIANE